MRVCVCVSAARHGLEWLLGRLNPARGDAMVLAVGRAIDCNEQVTDACHS